VARCEIELGQLVDDPDLVTSGTAVLDALGDMTHLSRVAALRR
jgi:hypothetical protein